MISGHGEAVPAFGGRAGRYVPQPQGYAAFVPEPLPPSPPLRMTASLVSKLSAADLALGRFDGTVNALHNADAFVGMHVRQEAVLSSQIEGAQASLLDLVEMELWPAEGGPSAVRKIVGYVDAMNHGLVRLAHLPLSLQLVREIHEKLVAKVHGGDHEPGRFRTAQNWIGPPGSTPRSALFVPPPPEELDTALGQLEKFWHERQMPTLIRAGLAHAQFESIHPFRDGSGRVGRLLIILMLCSEGVLRQPLLCLSRYLKQRRADYYDALQAVRDGGLWEDWLAFFLDGVAEVAGEATTIVRSIVELREEHKTLVRTEGTAANNLLRLLDLLYQQPIVTVSYVRDHLGVRYPTANELIGRFVRIGILTETTGQRRNRRYAYVRYLDHFPSV